jgi:predicted component of type VI protein secretion system
VVGGGTVVAAPSTVERRSPEGDPRPDTPRAVRVLQAFCESLVVFREGFEEAGRDLGVRPFAQRGPVHSATDAAELMGYLLDESGDLEARLGDIRAIFVDFARHQISMMSALDEGMRAVLARVDPRSFDVEKGSRFLPSLDKGNWQRLVTAFQSLEGNDRELHEILFGAEFAEAYAAQASQPDPTPSPAHRSKVGRKSRA